VVALAGAVTEMVLESTNVVENVEEELPRFVTPLL